jgi:hypothetical protein
MKQLAVAGAVGFAALTPWGAAAQQATGITPSPVKNVFQVGWGPLEGVFGITGTGYTLQHFSLPLVFGNIATERPTPACPVSHALLAMSKLSKASLPARNATFHGSNMPNCNPGGKAECVVALMTHPSIQRAQCAHD